MPKPIPPKPPPPTMGEMMRAARDRLGKSQAQIADELGVTQPLIAKWEGGRGSPRTEDVRRVAMAYGIKLELLIPEAKAF